MKYDRLNSNHLKIIAMVAMTIDHVADLIYPGFPNNSIAILLHIIGRITAPIFFFFICEGFFYTSNVRRYILRLFMFAFISHFAYCFAFGISFIPFSQGDIFNQTSVMWPLAWAVVALWITYKSKLKQWQQQILMLAILIITFPSDWSCIAVLIIVSTYKNRGNLKKQALSTMIWVTIYAIISVLFVNPVYGFVQFAVILAFLVLKNYNGKLGSAKWMKWVFYLYYPVHLIILGLLRLHFYGNIPLLF